MLLVACGPTGDTQPGSSTAESGNTSEWFVDRAQEVGLDFRHFNGMSGDFYMTEILAPGVALLDYDNDGDLDVYVVQGEMLGPGKTLSQARFPPEGPLPPKDRLYRNDLQVLPDGSRTLRFTDVTDASGIVSRGYGMGVAAADYDNDGWVDLYVTRFEANQMFRNNGDGTFSDVSARTGTDDPSWSVSASFVDVDRDGWLDLFVGNYLRYTADTPKPCVSPSGVADYCAPAGYRPLPDRLYRNRGDGTFVEITAEAGLRSTVIEAADQPRLRSSFGPALGVATADYNGDGWMDIYVANDGTENQLWINQRDGTFHDTALLAGVALSAEGDAEGSMGVDAGDFDNDGDEDLFMTHLTKEGHNLYINDGTGSFEDRSRASGLGVPSLPYTGFGTAWFDFDNDGWLDLLTVNGTVRFVEELVRANDPFPFHQPKQLFRNLGNGLFEDVTAQAGRVFQLSEVGRGAAFGDIDNDGDIDVLIGNNNGPLRLLVNNVGSQNHWIGLRLVGGTTTRRDMLGARVGVVLADGSTRWRRVRSDGSYASANDPRVIVGLGEATEVRRVQVRWPSGETEEWPDPAVDAWTTFAEGTGRTARDAAP